MERFGTPGSPPHWRWAEVDWQSLRVRRDRAGILAWVQKTRIIGVDAGRRVDEPAIWLNGVNDKISRVAALMSSLRIKQVPVLDGDKLAGLVARSDLIRACPPDLNPFSLLGPIARGTGATGPPLCDDRDRHGGTRNAAGGRRPSLDRAQHQRLARGFRGPTRGRHRRLGHLPRSARRFGRGRAGVRIAFDVGGDEDVFTFVTDLARKHGVHVVSVTAFEQEGQRVAVVRVDREKPAMVDEDKVYRA